MKVRKDNTVSLATKYKVPFTSGKAQAGCPGIMNPLGETPVIELQWGSGFCNQDKTERFNQFAKALEIIELYTNSSIERFKSEYLTLNIHGRVMLAYIAEKNGYWPELSLSVEDILTEGLNLSEIPYGKGGVSISQIFDHYITPKIIPSEPLSDFSLIHRGEGKKESQEKSEAPRKSIRIDDTIELSPDELCEQIAAMQRFEHLVSKHLDIERGSDSVISEEFVSQLYLAEKPLFTGKFVHQYLLYINEEGHELQIHGMAVTHDGISNVGMRGNKLQVFIFDKNSEYFEQNALANHKTKLLCVDQQAKENWDRAEKVVRAINEQDCKYDPLGLTKPNSNSVAATLCYVMGYKPMKLSGVSAPGLTRKILSEIQCKSFSRDVGSLDISYDELFNTNQDYTEVMNGTLEVVGDLDSCCVM